MLNSRKLKACLMTLLAALVCVAQASAIHAQSAKPPNIIVILADDIGYGDLGCYGATKVKTPNLDRIAKQGRRFTDAHSPSAMCSPTRYALLTGRYAFRHPPVARGVLSGVSPLAIESNRLTLAQMLQRAGYTTGVVGKWHLGLGQEQPDYNGELKPGPLEVGFNYFFGFSATGDRTPCVYLENHRVVNADAADPIQVSFKGKIGNDPTGKENPELLTHKPSHGHDNTIVNGISRIGFMSGGKKARWVDEDMADTLTRKAVGFIESNKDRPFFLYFATHDIHVPRIPHPRFKGTSEHGTRGDVIQQLDWSVGEILAALERLNLAEDTLIIFSSDNGGVMDDGYQDGSGSDPSGHRCNGVLRGFKTMLYEGGHRVPLLVRWPRRTPHGTSDALVCLVDLPASLASLASLTKQTPAKGDFPDSRNVLPALLGEAGAKGRERLVMHAGSGDLAIRKGSWVLIPGKTDAKGNRRPDELYDLARDLPQERNLAADQPALVRDLAALLAELRERHESEVP